MRYCPKETILTQKKCALLLFRVFVLVLAFVPHSVKSQDAVVQGIVKDTVGSTVPDKAVISLINATDSVLENFTRVSGTGNFRLENLKPGKYILMVTYPGYADYIEPVQILQADDVLSKALFITPKATLLDEVVLQQSVLYLRGDTTEYIASRFKLKENATVEDLLRQLPGIQVDPQGNIIAQGRKIEKILVDGEEFFSDDPTIATRNMRADAVQKVQVYDKKSDQAEFSGVNDGNTANTLNLELKESAKEGYFGKLSAGALDEYYNGQAVINSFRNKRQLSAFFIASTTNETGLADAEAGNYGFANDNVTVDEGSGTVFINSSSKNDFDVSVFDGEGLPTSQKGGLHFADQPVGSKFRYSGNYLFNHLLRENNSGTIRENFLEDSVYYNREAAETRTDNYFNGLRSRINFQIDSATSLRLAVQGKVESFAADADFNAQTLDATNTSVNKSLRKTSRSATNSDFNFDVLLKRRFRKAGRTLSFTVNHGFRDENTSGNLYNETNFFSRNNLSSTETIDLKKQDMLSNNSLQTRLLFTERISDHSFVQLNYGWFRLAAKEDKKAFARDFEGKYVEKVDELTDRFDYSYHIHSGGLLYFLKYVNANFSVGGRVTNTLFQNQTVKQAVSVNRNDLIFSPEGSFSYKFGSNRYIKVTYDEQIHQPQLYQLQPVMNNSNPLDVFVGNPDLKQEIEKNLQVNFSNYNMIKEKYLFITSSATFTPGMFSFDYQTDNKGKRTTRYINSDGFLAVLAGGYNFKLKGTKVRLGITPSVSYASFINVINGQKNTAALWFSSLRFTWGYYGDRVTIDGFITPQNNFSSYSINKREKADLWSLKSSTYFSLNLPGKFEVGADINLALRQQITSFDKNNQVVLLNAYAEKRFLQSGSLALRFSTKDILNQNKGYVQNVYPFYTEERSYSTFRRYGLLSLTYNFNKGGNKAKTDDSINL